jgi:hypothetical protein
MSKQVFSQARFWLLLYLGVQATLFAFYAYPLLKPFQQLWSSLFIAAVILSSLTLPSRLLAIPLILSAVLIDPLYTLSVATLQFRYKILVGLVVALLLFIKRKDQLSTTIILLLGNMGLFAIQQYKISKIDEQFRIRSYVTKEQNRLVLQVDSAVKARSNVYAVILDGYPDFKILEDSFQYRSKLLDSLKGFEWQQPFTIYYHSPISVLYIFASRKIDTKENPEYLLTNRAFMHKALYSSPLTQKLGKHGYSFNFHTLMLDHPGAWENPFNPIEFWPQYSINDITYVIWRYLIFKKRRPGQPTSLKQYHHKLFTALEESITSKENKLAAFHFMTFHNSFETIGKDASYADSLGLAAVRSIILNDPKATIIVLSDHGERRYLKNKENFHKGTYGIRRGY